MATTTFNEIIEKTDKLTSDECRQLIEFLQEREKQSAENGRGASNGYVSADTLWVKEHHAEYAGKYVALKDGKLIAAGKTIKEVSLKAKEKGVERPFLHRIPAEGEEVWGGW